MGEKRRRFSREFKEEAVRVAYGSGRPLAEMAREMDLRPDMLRRWKKQLEKREASGATNPEKELLRLRRKLARVEEERDILKKALAIVSDRPR